MANEPTVLEKQAAELERDAYEAIQKAILHLSDAEDHLEAEVNPSRPSARLDRIAFYAKMMRSLHAVETELHQTMSTKRRDHSLDPYHYPL